MGIESELRGEEIRSEQGGCFYSFESPASLPVYNLMKNIRQDCDALGSSAALDIFPALRKADPYKIGFFDIETLGLNHSDIIFLASFGHLTLGGFKALSFLARDPGEEAVMIAATLEHMHSLDAVCTFNGKSFDIERLGKRSQQLGLMVNGFRYKPLGECLAGKHIDLRDLFPKGSLQTLERGLLHYIREDDIAGSRIPAIYRAYIEGKEGAEDCMPGVIRHNQIDCFSLCALFLYACRHATSYTSRKEGARDSSSPLHAHTPSLPHYRHAHRPEIPLYA